MHVQEKKQCTKVNFENTTFQIAQMPTVASCDIQDHGLWIIIFCDVIANLKYYYCTHFMHGKVIYRYTPNE